MIVVEKCFLVIILGSKGITLLFGSYRISDKEFVTGYLVGIDPGRNDDYERDHNNRYPKIAGIAFQIQFFRFVRNAVGPAYPAGIKAFRNGGTAFATFHILLSDTDIRSVFIILGDLGKNVCYKASDIRITGNTEAPA